MNDKGEKQYKKMTETPVQRLIITLSIPTVISMLITSIYNMVDTAFVGQLGTSASGAVGIVFSLMTVIQAIGFMLGQGSGSILSRMLGARDYQGASRMASTSFFTALFMGSLILVFGLIFIDPLVYFLGSTRTIAPYAKSYITYILLACPAMIATFVMNNILRYEGKAILGMVGLLAGSLLNILGDPILMFHFNMGIAGAGLSTAISQYIGFFILLYMFLSQRTQTRLSIFRVDRNPAVIGNIFATGLPSLIRQSLTGVYTMVLNRAAGVYGDAAVSAMSIVSRIGMFIFSFSLGIGQGFQPVCAFNYGAKKYKRVKSAYYFTILLSEAIIILISSIVLIHSGSLIQLFRDDPEVITIGTRALRLYCVGLVFVPFGTVTEMMMQSTGYRMHASIMSSLRNGVIAIPLLILLSYTRGLAGIQESQPFTYVLTIIPSIYMMLLYFRKEKEAGHIK